MSVLLKKSLADVTRRKSRTALVVLGIFIGVFGLTAINFTQDTLLNAYTYSLGLHADWPDIVFDVATLDPALRARLVAVPNVRTVQLQSIFDTEWHVSRAPGHVPLAIDSYPDPQVHPLTPWELTAGRLPGPGEIVMDASDQTFQAVRVGDTVSVNAPGGPTSLQVVGLARRPGTSGSDRGLGFMSDAGLRQLVGGDLDAAAPGKRALSHSIMVQVADAAQTEATAGALRGVLSSAGVPVVDTAFPRAPSVPLDQVNGVFTLLRLLVGLALAMTALLILNTVTTLVAEQTAIIGTMKALGGTRGAVFRGYLASVGIYSGLATLPGVVLGVAGGWLLASSLATTIPLDLGPFALAPAIPLLSLVVGLGVPLLAALIPLWLGTRIPVREALAAYGVSAGAGSGRLARLGSRFPGVSQTVWLGLRGAFRKPGRTALMLLTLTFAGTSFLIAQSAAGSVSHTVAVAHGILNADVNVQLAGPQPFSPVRDQIAALPNVARVERHDANHVTTPWGVISLVGAEPGSALYQPPLVSGRALRPGDMNVVLLSDALAARSGLGPGSTLTLPATSGLPLTLTVAGIVQQPVEVLGWVGAAVVPIDTFYRLTGVPAGQASTVARAVVVRAQDRSPAAVDRLARAVDSALNPAAASGRGESVARVETLADYTARREQTWYTLYALLYGVALVVGAAGVVGLANALTAAVLERRREIGLLRALGATGRRIARVFWVEALTLAVLAAVAAALLGLPLAWAFVALLSRLVIPVQFVVDPAALGVLLVAVLAIASVASLGPALQAARLRVAGLLRYE